MQPRCVSGLIGPHLRGTAVIAKAAQIALKEHRRAVHELLGIAASEVPRESSLGVFLTLR